MSTFYAASHNNRKNILQPFSTWKRLFSVFHLEYGSVIEQSKQLQQVIQDVAFLLLHPQDVRWVEWFGAVHLQFLVERKETELEEIFDDYGNLRTQTGMNATPADR